MADIICKKCGEPWDYYGLKDGDVEPDEARRILAGEGCPCCDFGNNIGIGIRSHEYEHFSSLLRNSEDDEIIKAAWNGTL